MKKGDIVTGIVTGLKFPDKGVVCAEGETIAVPDVVPGQEVRVRISKKRGGKFTGILQEQDLRSLGDKDRGHPRVCKLFKLRYMVVIKCEFHTDGPPMCLIYMISHFSKNVQLIKKYYTRPKSKQESIG